MGKIQLKSFIILHFYQVFFNFLLGSCWISIATPSTIGETHLQPISIFFLSLQSCIKNSCFYDSICVYLHKEYYQVIKLKNDLEDLVHFSFVLQADGIKIWQQYEVEADTNPLLFPSNRVCRWPYRGGGCRWRNIRPDYSHLAGGPRLYLVLQVSWRQSSLVMNTSLLVGSSLRRAAWWVLWR